MRLRNFGESFKKFYGFTFEEYFGIPFKKFRDTFDSHDRDAILARTKDVKYDEVQRIYYTVNAKDSDSKVVLTLSQEDIEKLKKLLEEVTAPDILKFFSSYRLMDGLKTPILPANDTPNSFEAPHIGTIRPFQLYQFESSEDRANSQNQIQSEQTNEPAFQDVADSISLDEK